MMIYNPEESSALITAIPDLHKVAEFLHAETVAPTKTQCKKASEIIWSLIRRRGRIIYGGHALNAALGQNSPDNMIYTKDDNADIEFYSPDPISDMRELCDRLYIDGHCYVQGREAAHLGTFTVSIEFKRICDITFVPHNVFKALPFIEYNKDPESLSTIAGIDPRFALIDHLRMFCDPFTSHWKLEKTLPRLLLIQSIFPIETPQKTQKPSKYARGPEIPLAMAWLADRSMTAAAVGDLASSYFAGDVDAQPPLHLQVCRF
jgi:hypothetical protein